MAGLRHSGITLQKILSDIDQTSRQTKIICTLGPSCASKAMLSTLIGVGMNVARFNFSHGDHTSHKMMLRVLRAAMRDHPDKHVTIMLDTKGPEIRTGMLEGGTAIELDAGQELEITTDYSFLGNKNKIACSYAALPISVDVGGIIFIADGSLTVTVLETRQMSILVQCQNSCTLGQKKNMNLPGVSVQLPVLSPKDVSDIINWGLNDNCGVEGEVMDDSMRDLNDDEYRGRISIDAIAASFVCRAEDVRMIRRVLGERGQNVKIIAKIENQEGLRNFDEILREADGIMVARGDLGMEIPPERVFLAQKMMIRKCNVAGKPVVTATQMLESMINSPRPTRAECADVANAVLDGTDCVMLSGETANGKFPMAAVTMMAKCCCEAELMLNYESIYNATCLSVAREPGQMFENESIASSAVKTSIDLKAKIIVVLSQSGRTAQLIAKYRPKCRVISMTIDPAVARQSNGFHRGVRCLVSGNFESTDAVVREAINFAMSQEEDLVVHDDDANDSSSSKKRKVKTKTRWVKQGDVVVAVHGMMGGIVSGSTNMMRVIIV